MLEWYKTAAAWEKKAMFVLMYGLASRVVVSCQRSVQSIHRLCIIASAMHFLRNVL